MVSVYRNRKNHTAARWSRRWKIHHDDLESERRKAEIRDRIHKQTEQGQKTAKDYFRPAKPTPSIYDSDLKRVAVYARVSTSSEEQISSIENQTLYYTKKIAETENWNLQDIYSDEGKSGTSLRKRDAFKRMMQDAKDQKMDLIICASISRFARNFTDCMTQIAALKTMHPAHPIGVYFETENIYTLNPNSQYNLDMPLSLLEAMSYGNCCLVSDIPECAEVVEDKALIFKKSDVKDLQEKLQDACDHPEMVMKMKNQAADFICEKYNWDEVVKKTMKLYRRK